MKRLLLLSAIFAATLTIASPAQAGGLNISYGGISYSQGGHNRNFNYGNHIAQRNQGYYTNRTHNNSSFIFQNQHRSSFVNHGQSYYNLGHSNSMNNQFQSHGNRTIYTPVHNRSFNSGRYSH